MSKFSNEANFCIFNVNMVVVAWPTFSQQEAMADVGVAAGLPQDLGLASQTVSVHSIKICCGPLFIFAYVV